MGDVHFYRFDGFKPPDFYEQPGHNVQVGFRCTLEFILVAQNEDLDRSTIGVDLSGNDKSIPSIVANTGENEKVFVPDTEFF